MHNKRFQNELGNFKGDTLSIRNSSHKAFVEKLKEQVSSDDSPSSTGGVDTNDDDVCSDEMIKELKVKHDELFANLDDND